MGDTLILKDKTKYVGILTSFVDEEIMFEAFLSTNSLRSKFPTVIIDDIEGLKLNDRTMVIDNGIIVATNAERIKNTDYYRYLNISKELKRGKSIHIIIGCGIISVVALGGLYLYFVQTFNLGL